MLVPFNHFPNLVTTKKMIHELKECMVPCYLFDMLNFSCNALAIVLNCVHSNTCCRYWKNRPSTWNNYKLVLTTVIITHLCSACGCHGFQFSFTIHGATSGVWLYIAPIKRMLLFFCGFDSRSNLSFFWIRKSFANTTYNWFDSNATIPGIAWNQDSQCLARSKRVWLHIERTKRISLFLYRFWYAVTKIWDLSINFDVFEFINHFDSKQYEPGCTWHGLKSGLTMPGAVRREPGVCGCIFLELNGSKCTSFCPPPLPPPEIRLDNAWRGEARTWRIWL